MDRDTLQALRAREPQAAEAFVEWFCDEFIPFLSSHFDRGHVDDLLQNTLTEVLAKLGTDDMPVEPVAFRKWVYGFAWNKVRAAARDPFRRLARQAKLMNAPLPEHPPGPESSTAEAELVELIRRGIVELPDIYRQAIEHVLDGGDYRSLAENEMLDEGTARRRIWEARKRLRLIVQAMRVTQMAMRSPAH